MTRARVVVTANAISRLGGQGVNLHHVATALGPVADLTVLSPGGADDATTIPRARLPGALARIPGVRRRRDWYTWLAERDFDLQAARRLPPADLVYGVTGQCLRTLQVAHARGAATVVDSVTAHVAAFAEAALPACRRFGVRFPIHRGLQRRMQREYARADRIRVMSERARQTFLARGFAADRVGVVPPALWSEQFPETIRPIERFRVGFVGGLEPWKGFHYLIEAFRQVARADWELILFGGSGSHTVSQYVRRVTSEDPRVVVRLLDLRREGFERVYGELSVLVHPSLSDGFGLVVGEAMACGVPVIVTDATGAADLVTDASTGFVVQPGDVDDLARRLEWCADHREDLPDMGRRARDAVSHLTAEHFRDALGALISGLVPAWPAPAPQAG